MTSPFFKTILIASIAFSALSCTLTLYEHCNYDGWSQTYSDGSFDLNGYLIDRVSSLKMTDGCQATICEHPTWFDTRGKCVTYYYDDPCMHDEKINDMASYVILKNRCEYLDTYYKNGECRSCSPKNTYRSKTSATCSQRCNGDNTYYDRFSGCVRCPNNQYFSEKKNICVDCDNKNEYFSNSQQKCVACSGPNEYNYHGDCISCSSWETFQESVNGCAPCGGLNAYYDTSADQCTTCSSFKIYDRQQGDCTFCPSSQDFYTSSSDSCVPCDSNQYFDQKKLSCQDCNDGKQNAYFSRSANSCTSCPEFYVYDGSSPTLCGECPIKNQRYLASNDACTSCEQTNQQFDYSKGECVECSKKNQRFLESENTCVACPQGNQIYNPETNKCELCGTKNMYFSTSENKCVYCPLPNQYYDADIGHCVACPYKNQFFEEEIDDCKACEIKNQLFDPQQNDCVDCTWKNEIFDQDINDCRDCDETNQIFNVTANQCVNCTYANEFYYRPIDTCKTCDRTDEIYDTVTDECIECPFDNEYFSQQFNRCYPCNYNTDYYDEEQKECLKCGKKNAYFDENLNNCTKCPKNNEFFVGTSCIECPQGNMFFNEALDECGFCNTTKSYFDNSTCHYCDSHKQFYNLTEGSCYDCPGNNTYYSEEQEECVDCPLKNQYFDFGLDGCMNCTGTNLYWNETVKQCVSCGNSSTFDVHFNAKLGKCETCSNSHEYYNTTTNQCEECPGANMFFNTIARQCMVCSYLNQFYNTTAHECQFCPARNLYFDQNTQNCSECAPGQFFDNNTAPGQCMDCQYKNQYYNLTSGKCETCSDITQIFDQSQGKCVSCGNNSLFSNDSNACVCYNNARYDFKSQQCVKCGPAEVMYPDIHTGTCQPCSSVYSPNSYFDIGLNSCAECDSNQVLDVQTGNCANCQINQHYESKENTCEDCPYNHIYNMTTQNCTFCGNSSFVDFQARKCSSCDQGCLACNGTSSNCTECASKYHSVKDQNACVSECPDGYYLDEDEDSCVKQCPDGQYGSDDTKLCTACDDKCATCYGSGFTKCHSCNFGYVFTAPSSCVSFGSAIKWGEDNITAGWTVPKDGDTVIIKQDQVIVISEDTASVDTIIVDGTLYIDPHATQNITISTRRLYVRDGLFHFNGTEIPDLDVKLLMSSTIDSFSHEDNLNISGYNIEQIPNSIIVSGTFQASGAPKTPIARLAQSAYPSDTTIVLDTNVSNWRVGDKIVLASSSFNSSENEVVLITDVLNNTLEIQPALRFYHSGDQTPFETIAGTLDLRAEVAMLSSNFIIQGQETSVDACQMYVINEVINQTNKTGSVQIEDTQFDLCGKTGYGNGAIIFQNIRGGSFTGSSVARSKFTFSQSAGVFINNSIDVTIDSNVFYRTTNNSIVVDGINDIPIDQPVIISNNYIFANQLFDGLVPGDLDGDGSSIPGSNNSASSMNSIPGSNNSASSGQQLLPKSLESSDGDSSDSSEMSESDNDFDISLLLGASIFVQVTDDFVYDNNNLVVQGNVISSEESVGFITPAMNCGGSAATQSIFFANNTVHSSFYGWIVNNSPRTTTCLEVSGLTAYLVENGIATYPFLSTTAYNGAILTAENLLFTDNKQSLTLQAGFTAGDSAKIRIQNSFFGGMYLEQLYNKTAFACNSFTGIRMSDITVGGKFLPLFPTQEPFWRPQTSPIFNQVVEVDQVTFANWNDGINVDCSNMSIFRPNYYAYDQTAFHKILSANWINVPQDFVFNTWSYAMEPNANISNLGAFDYSGRYNYIIKDYTEEQTMPGGPVIVPNNEFFKYWNDSDCDHVSGWHGYSCGSDIGVLLFALNQTVTRFNISNSQGTFNNIITKNKVNSTYYSSIIKANETYIMDFTSNGAHNLTLQAQGLEDNDYVIIQYALNKSALNNSYVQLKLNGKVVNPITQIQDQLDVELGENYKSCGNYLLDLNSNTVSILLTGASSCKIESYMAYSVKMTTKIEASYTQFMKDFGIDGYREFLSNTLGVKPERIIFENIYEGSVIAEYYVIADPDSNGAQQQSDLNKIISSTKAKLDAFNFKLKDGSIVPVTVTIDGSLFLGPDGKPINDDDASNVTQRVLYAALIGAGVILVALICLKLFGGKSKRLRLEEEKREELELTEVNQTIEL